MELATSGRGDLPLLAQPLLRVYKRLDSDAFESRLGYSVGTRMYSECMGLADEQTILEIGIQIRAVAALPTV